LKAVPDFEPIVRRSFWRGPVMFVFLLTLLAFTLCVALPVMLVVLLWGHL
jgi:hypothetical protein